MYFSFELFMLSMFFFFLGLYMYMWDEFIYLEWSLISVGNVDFAYQVYLDFYGVMFMSVILLVSCMVCIYSYWYVDLYKVRFYYMMFGFISSMLILVISPNLMGMLLGWDGLGFISFCLVLFYYNSSISLDNSLVTLYYNRLGDGFLLVSIGGMLFSVGGCEGLMWDWGFIISILMLMGLSTKSAQFPFMSWLPKAMSAPTPVSSLVHSSTLVTAGIYIMFRFLNNILYNSMYMYISLITMFISGILALLEMDMKKVIAYSTLSQLGLMVFGLCLGMSEFVYFHMLSHAIFKSMMFMSGGIMIHELGGWQDLRYYGSCISYMPISGMCFLTGSFSLSGFYFLSGFYSKDILIEGFMLGSVNLFMYMLFYFCMMTTLLYSYRLLDCLSLNFISVNYLGGEDGPMSFCLVILYLGSIIYGCLLNNLILGFELYSYIPFSVKLYIMMMGFLTVLNLFEMPWIYLHYLSMDIHKVFKNYILLSSIEYLDKYWVESYGGYKIMFNINNLMYSFKDYSIYFMFMLFFFIYMFI